MKKKNDALSYLGYDVVSWENHFQNTREELYVLARWQVTITGKSEEKNDRL
jgi:hypothetical protein